MSSKKFQHKKVERCISYSEELDTYYVQFTFADHSHLRSFPTLEDARVYRDSVYLAKLEEKIKKDTALVRKRELKWLKDFVPYPYNAFELINLKAKDIDPETINNFENILAAACNNYRDVECFHLFFEEGWTLQETGKRFGITKERVRQILNVAIRKVVGLVNERKLKLKAEIDLADRHALRTKLIEAYKATGVITPELEYEFGKLKVGTSCLKGVVSIDDLLLTARSRNALIKAGIETVNELVSYPVSEIEKLKNMGKKSLNEIVKKVAELGFEFASEAK